MNHAKTTLGIPLMGPDPTTLIRASMRFGLWKQGEEMGGSGYNALQ
jgi:hypothetical protein